MPFSEPYRVTMDSQSAFQLALPRTKAHTARRATARRCCLHLQMWIAQNIQWLMAHILRRFVILFGSFWPFKKQGKMGKYI